MRCSSRTAAPSCSTASRSTASAAPSLRRSSPRPTGCGPCNVADRPTSRSVGLARLGCARAARLGVADRAGRRGAERPSVERPPAGSSPTRPRLETLAVQPRPGRGDGRPAGLALGEPGVARAQGSLSDCRTAAGRYGSDGHVDCGCDDAAVRAGVRALRWPLAPIPDASPPTDAVIRVDATRRGDPCPGRTARLPRDRPVGRPLRGDRRGPAVVPFTSAYVPRIFGGMPATTDARDGCDRRPAGAPAPERDCANPGVSIPGTTRSTRRGSSRARTNTSPTPDAVTGIVTALVADSPGTTLRRPRLLAARAGRRRDPARGAARARRRGRARAHPVSGISRGTESLVFRGGVPRRSTVAMRAPFQEGDFPGPVKYGYLSVGVVERGPAELRGARCSACTHTRRRTSCRPPRCRSCPRMCRPLAPCSPAASRRRSTPCGTPRRCSATGSPSSAPGWSAAASPACSAGSPRWTVTLVDVDPGRAESPPPSASISPCRTTRRRTATWSCTPARRRPGCSGRSTCSRRRAP